jgi:HD superfamily phosphohydrolase YqeK
MPKDGQFVRSEFARTLETELAAVTKQRDELAAALHDILNDAPDSPLWKIKAAVAALKSIEDTNQ